jgi:hypothetical protein
MLPLLTGLFVIYTKAREARKETSLLILWSLLFPLGSLRALV